MKIIRAHCCVVFSIFAERIYDKHVKNASIVTRHGLAVTGVTDILMCVIDKRGWESGSRVEGTDGDGVGMALLSSRERA